MTPDERIANYRLERPLARGGSGEVWLGSHAPSGTPVAVKVLTPEASDDPAWRAALRREARVLASLDHPHIMGILDAGELSGEGGHAPRPYLVLELASGGALTSWMVTPPPWAVLRGTLLRLLDALGHAHARGVLHRDLKLANVMLSGPHDLRPGLKLADFGSSLPLDGRDLEGGEGSVGPGLVGTPLYMAPEQWAQEARLFGPWTDLYALGIMTWMLVHGEQPWEARGRRELAAAHMGTPLPWPEETRVRAPKGLEAWVRRLAEKDPGGRFQRASDAAVALAALEGGGHDEPDARWLSELGVSLLAPPVPTPEAMTTGLTGDNRTWAIDSVTFSMTVVAARAEAVTMATPSQSPAGACVALSEAPPMSPARGTRLPGEGLALSLLRTPPLVGRHTSQDLLWQALRRSLTGPVLVRVRGVGGVGRTRLCTWLAESAHAQGAEVLWAGFREEGDDELDRAFARCLRVVGLEGEALDRALTRALGPMDPADLAGLRAAIRPNEDARARDPQEAAAIGAERGLAYAAALRLLARRRPMLVVLDDVAWSDSAIGFLEQILASPQPVPALFVFTQQEGGQAGPPEALERLGRLVTRPDAVDHGLDPISDTTTLVRALVDLEPILSAEVGERTGGNPQFAMQLIGGWIGAGLLRAGPHGFRLVMGAGTSTPSSLADLWAARARALAQGLKPAQLLAVERAAALDLRVEMEGWAEASAAEPAIPEASIAGWLQALLDHLLAQGLAMRDQGSDAEAWSFAHFLAREALLEAAAAAGRAQSHQLACARSTRARGAPPRVVGLHLLRAGRAQEAAPLLLEAAQRLTNMGEVAHCERLLDQLEAGLDHAAEPPDSLWRAGVGRLRAICAQQAMDTALAEELQLKVESMGAERMHDPAWRRLVIQTRLDRTETKRRAHQLLEADALISENMQLPEASADPEVYVTLRRQRARIQEQLGRSNEAIETLLETLAYIERHGLHWLAGRLRFNLLLVTGAVGRWDIAAQHLEPAIEALRASNERVYLIGCLNTAGEVHRARGDLDAAERAYTETAELARSINNADWALAMVNLAFVRLERGHYTDAVAVLRQIRPDVAGKGAHGDQVRTATTLGLTYAFTFLDQWDAWDASFSELDALTRDVTWAQIDLARMTWTIGERAFARGYPERAIPVWELSARQWGNLGRPDEVERVRQAIAEASQANDARVWEI